MKSAELRRFNYRLHEHQKINFFLVIMKMHFTAFIMGQDLALVY